MQYAEQRKQPPRRVEVGLDLAVEPLFEGLAPFVVKAAARHVDSLDLTRRRVADRVVVALADHEIILDDPAERRHRQAEHDHPLVALGVNVENETSLGSRELEPVGSKIMA